MSTKVTIEFDADVSEILDRECQRRNKSVSQVVNEIVRDHPPPNSHPENGKKPISFKPFSLEFAPEFEGMTPKEILNVLDDEYYAKKLAGGTEEYEAMKRAQ